MIALALLFFSGLPLSYADETPDSNQWIKILSPYVHTFQRPIRLYHYGTRDKSEFKDGKCPTGSSCGEVMDLAINGDYDSPVPLKHPKATQYFREMTGLFAQAVNNGWTMGGGLYTAIDPLQSMNWAGTPWFLLEIDVALGTKYIDSRKMDDVTYSRFLEAMASGTAESHKSIDTAFAALGVGVVAYDWDANTETLEMCRETWFQAPKTGKLLGNGAFVFISSRVLKHLRFKIFVNALEDTVSADPVKIQNYKRLAEKISIQDWLIEKGSIEGRNEYPSLTKAWTDRFNVEKFTQTQKLSLYKKVQNETFSCSPDSRYRSEYTK